MTCMRFGDFAECFFYKMKPHFFFLHSEIRKKKNNNWDYVNAQQTMGFNQFRSFQQGTSKGPHQKLSLLFFFSHVVGALSQKRSEFMARQFKYEFHTAYLLRQLPFVLPSKYFDYVLRDIGSVFAIPTGGASNL